MKKSKELKLIVTYIIVLLMIVDSNSIFMTGTASSLLSKAIMLLMTMAVCVLISRVRLSSRDYQNYTVSILVIFMYLLIYIVITNLWLGKGDLKSSLIIFIKFLLMYTIVALVYKKEKNPQILIAYSNLVCIIAVISIFFWIFGSQLQLIHPTGVYMSNWSNLYGGYDSKATYYNIYFETQWLDNVVRNSAIFAEAPMASLTFSVAITLENLYGKECKFHKLKLLILILAVLTTFSSTGYICLIINLVYLLLKNRSKKSNFLLVLVPVILIVGVLGINYIFSNKLQTSSGISRSVDYMNAFTAWEKYPFLGIGINNGSKLLYGIGKFGYSNSFGKILGEGGIYLTLLYIYPFIVSLWRAYNMKSLRQLFLTIIVVFLFITTIFTNTYLLYFLLSFLALWKPKQDSN